MRPRLFGDNPSRFDTNGIGVLTKTVSAFVKEELNGEYSLTMQIAVDDPQFQNIHIGSCIAVQPNKYDQRQGFIVEHIKKPIDGICEIYATHIVQYRGKLIPVNPFEATSLATALTAMKSNSAETNPFTITTNKSVSSAMKTIVPRTFRELMGGISGSLLDRYGGEYYYNNYDIELLNRRGRETNIRILYGKNMTAFDLNEDFSWTDSLTGVIPFWSSEDGTAVVGSIHYSDLATNFPYARTGVLDCSGTFAEQPTAEELDTYAASWIQDKGNIVVNLNVAFDHLQITDTDMQIGDTVTVINSMYNTEVKRRIVGYEFNVLTEEYETVTIGALKASVNSAIAAIGLVNGDSSGGGGGTSYSEMTEEEATAGTSRDPRVISAYVLNKAIESASVGHADSADTATDATYATRLKTGRAIDGVTFTGTAAIRHSTTCDTAEATAAKVAALSNFTLVTGARVTVTFTYAIPANATLNVNSTGAKPIWFNGAAITAGIIPAGASVTFIYDGTNYLVITSNKWSPSYQGWANTQTKLVGESVTLPTFGNVVTSSVNNSISANANNKAVYPYTSQIVDQNIYSTVFMGNCSTAADVAAKTASVGTSFHLHAGVQVVLKFTNTNSASNCTLNVNSTGAYPIYYNAAEYTSNSALVCGTADRYIRYMFNGTHWVWLGHSADNNTTYSAMSQSEATTGTATTGRLITAKVLHDTIENAIPDAMTLVDGTEGTSTTAELISPKILHNVIGYLGGEYEAVCYTDANVAAKVLTADSSFFLNEGVTIVVDFANTNTASNVTLNVNNSGAIPIVYNGSTYTGSSSKVCGYANRLVKYKYYAGKWVWMGASYDENTTYSAMSQTEATAGTATTGRLITAEVLANTINQRVYFRELRVYSDSLTETQSGGTVTVGTKNILQANYEADLGIVSGIITDKYAAASIDTYPYSAHVVYDLFKSLFPTSETLYNGSEIVGSTHKITFEDVLQVSQTVFRTGDLWSANATASQKESYPYVAEVVDDLLDDKIGFSIGTALESGTDLNDLAVGTYYSSNATISASLVNTPYTGGGFRLDVIHTVGENTMYILFPNTTLIMPYYRYKASTTFGPWRQVGVNLTNYCDGVTYTSLADGIHASLANYIAAGGRTAGRQNLTLTVRVNSNYWTGTACWASATVCCGMLTSSNKDHNVIYKFRDATTDTTATLTQYTLTAV